MDCDSPLFLAHQSRRKAEIYLAKQCYDEAVECHERASELICHAMTLTKFAKALESLTHQNSYHLKQTDIIRAKKQIHLRLKENFILGNINMEKKGGLATIEDIRKIELQNEIFHAMEEADSLLGILEGGGRRRIIGDLAGSPDSYMKHPKDDRTVMEELKTVNGQLRALVTQLVSELEASKREIDRLKSLLSSQASLSDKLPALDLPPLDLTSL